MQQLEHLQEKPQWEVVAGRNLENTFVLLVEVSQPNQENHNSPATPTSISRSLRLPYNKQSINRSAMYLTRVISSRGEPILKKDKGKGRERMVGRDKQWNQWVKWGQVDCQTLESPCEPLLLRQQTWNTIYMK